ncbi:hypothetical protein EMPG_09281 [Blastomyces silverae]|uniref:Uncharacterized protein n=1 Tax=Blastomyces silverae TaxID=2060906 RepID=A0A0H1B5J8_9EURO|nr:hypothetical protein EMPG_09281 [Blastomyces silverae]
MTSQTPSDSFSAAAFQKRMEQSLLTPQSIHPSPPDPASHVPLTTHKSTPARRWLFSEAFADEPNDISYTDLLAKNLSDEERSMTSTADILSRTTTAMRTQPSVGNQLAESQEYQNQIEQVLTNGQALNLSKNQLHVPLNADKIQYIVDEIKKQIEYHLAQQRSALKNKLSESVKQRKYVSTVRGILVEMGSDTWKYWNSVDELLSLLKDDNDPKAFAEFLQLSLDKDRKAYPCRAVSDDEPSDEQAAEAAGAVGAVEVAEAVLRDDMEEAEDNY